jgi:hypothetical protein
MSIKNSTFARERHTYGNGVVPETKRPKAVVQSSKTGSELKKILAEPNHQKRSVRLRTFFEQNEPRSLDEHTMNVMAKPFATRNKSAILQHGQWLKQTVPDPVRRKQIYRLLENNTLSDRLAREWAKDASYVLLGNDKEA